MNRRSIVARVISVTGVLLLIAAAIHLLVTPTLKRVILDRVLTPERIADCLAAFPPQSHRHGNSAYSIGFVTIIVLLEYAKASVGHGHQPCQRADHSKSTDRACLGDAAGTFPIHRVSDCASLITIVGITMTVALVWVRHDFHQAERPLLLGRARQRTNG